MTIQNIEDVMERIMSLNRNLTEDSLRTLLSASGWDKEDIMEGIRLFKAKDKNIVIPSLNNIQSKVVEEQKESELKKEYSQDEFSKEKEKTEEVAYKFNIPRPPIINKSDVESSNKDGFSLNIEEEINNKITPEVSKLEKDISAKIPINIENIPKVLNYALDQTFAKQEIIPAKITSSSELETEKEKHTNIGKVLFFILLILILGFLTLYLYSKSFNGFINQKLFSSKNYNILNTQQPIQNQTNSNDGENLFPQKNTNDSVLENTNNKNSNQNKSGYEDLLNEIKNLKVELDNYKKSVETPKTVVKYISQKGPAGVAGKAGRGILSIEATSTGLVINFSDKSSSTIPYATTTNFNTIKSNQVCFKDENNASSTDTCLDKNLLLNILNK